MRSFLIQGADPFDTAVFHASKEDMVFVTTLKHKQDDIIAFYNKGYKGAEKIITFLNLWFRKNFISPCMFHDVYKGT